MTLVGTHVYSIARMDEYDDLYFIGKSPFAHVDVDNPPLLFMDEATAEAHIDRVIERRYDHQVLAWGESLADGKKNIEQADKRKQVLEAADLWDEQQEQVYLWHKQRNHPTPPEREDRTRYKVVPLPTY